MIRRSSVSQVLGALATMPFMTVDELAETAYLPERTTRDTMRRLEQASLVEAVTHSLSPRARAKRWCLTAGGIAELPQIRRQGESPADLLKILPVSAQWRTNLLRRLDAVAVMNRTARDVSDLGPNFTWRWERRGALDAAFQLPNGRVAGIVRIGASLSGRAVSSRLGTTLNLYGRGELHTALIIVPGPVDLQRIRHLLAETSLLVFVAFEQDLAQAPVGASTWRNLHGGPLIPLHLALLQPPVAELPRTRQPAQRASMPGAPIAEGVTEPDMLASTLSLPAKRMVDLLHDWPLVSAAHLQSMLDVSEGHMRRLKAELSNLGLVHYLRIGSNGVRLCLSDAGLRYLARRDRARLSDLFKRWSVARDPAGDESFKIPGHRIEGTKLRVLAKELRHTTGTYDVVSLVMRSCHRNISWRIAQILPAHRWERRFRYGTRRSRRRRDIWRVIKPDAAFVLEHRRERRQLSFIIEYERRANVPARMEERIQRYRAYYGSPDTATDFPGGRAGLLVVFRAREDASRFASYAFRSGDEEIPMLVSSIEEIESAGTALGNCWMMPWALDRGLVSPDVLG